MKRSLSWILAFFLLFYGLCAALTLIASANEIPIPGTDDIGDYDTDDGIENEFYRRKITGAKKETAESGETVAPETDPVPHPVDVQREILLPTAYLALGAVCIFLAAMLWNKRKPKQK